MADKRFVDAVHYIAFLLRNDDLHETALAVAQELAGSEFVTCEPVLFEVLAHVSALGPETREQAVGLVRDLRADPNTTILRVTEDLFGRSLELYERRADKEFSLTNCLAMVICKDLGITDVLTHDHHFEQEGLTILL